MSFTNGHKPTWQLILIKSYEIENAMKYFITLLDPLLNFGQQACWIVHVKIWKLLMNHPFSKPEPETLV